MRVVARALRGMYFPASHNHAVLTYDMFAAIIGSDSEAVEELYLSLFKASDTVDLEDVEALEFEEGFIRFFEERVQLQDSISGFDTASQVFESMLKVIYVCAAIITIAWSFDIEPKAVFMGAGTVFVAVSFAVSDAIVGIVKSLVFILGQRPVSSASTSSQDNMSSLCSKLNCDIVCLGVMFQYEIGDRVFFNDGDFYVKSINMLTTEFVDLTGRAMSLSNAQLSDKVIFNYKRSGAAVVEIKVVVSIQTTKTMLQKLETELRHFVRQHNENWRPGIDILLDNLGDVKTMNLRVRGFSRSTWQEQSLFDRRTEFAQAIRVALIKLDIKTSEPEPFELM